MLHVRKLALASMLGLGLAGHAAADEDFRGFRDFGSFRDHLLKQQSRKLFGVDEPVAASSRESITAAVANADPTRLVTLAKGLHARVASAAPNLAPNVDMIALWPDDRNPTHLIFCNEQGVDQPGRSATAPGRWPGRDDSHRNLFLRPCPPHPLGNDHRG